MTEIPEHLLRRATAARSGSFADAVARETERAGDTAILRWLLAEGVIYVHDTVIHGTVYRTELATEHARLLMPPFAERRLRELQGETDE